MRSVRLAFSRTRLVLLALLPLEAACLLVTPLDEVSESEGAYDDDAVGNSGGTTNGPSTGGTSSSGAGGTRNPGAGGTGNTNAGGTGNASAGGTENAGAGGNLPIGIGASPGIGGAGGTGNAPSDVTSWCPDPVALVAQGNPYIARFTLVSGDCPLLDDAEYRAGAGTGANCTIMEQPLTPDFCAYEEVEICSNVMLDTLTTADAVSRALILQVEPGGLVVGTVEFSFDFYLEGEYTASCTGTYDVTYTPQGLE